MKPDEARRLAEEYARSVPDDVHVPTLARMIEEHGVAVLNDKEATGSAPAKPAERLR